MKTVLWTLLNLILYVFWYWKWFLGINLGALFGAALVCFAAGIQQWATYAFVTLGVSATATVAAWIITAAINGFRYRNRSLDIRW